MEKNQFQVREKIETLIDQLELQDFKKDLLESLRFSYKLASFEDEDYAKLGNTRFGGLPDLPKDIEYPHNEKGYYNLLCQINFSDFKDTLGQLPEHGILYVFDGYSSEDDSVVIFSESTDHLERKNPPEGLTNLNSYYREDPYSAIKVKFTLGYYFIGKTIWEICDLYPEKYYQLMDNESKFESAVLTNSMDGLNHAYLEIKGFDTLVYTVLEPYESRMPAILRSIEIEMNQSELRDQYLLRKKEQLLEFDKQKDVHLKNMHKVTCLLGLESLSKLEWVWGDCGLKYVFILDEDLEKRNFNNVLVRTWSS